LLTEQREELSAAFDPDEAVIAECKRRIAGIDS
jgi:hypothetical protein